MMYKMTGIIMDYAPYGVFALIAGVAGEYGLDVLLPLAKVIVARLRGLHHSRSRGVRLNGQSLGAFESFPFL